MKKTEVDFLSYISDEPTQILKVNDLSLDEWTQKVDDLFYDKIGMGVYDVLGDFNSYDLWEGGATPEEAFAELADETIAELECIAEVGAMINPAVEEELEAELDDIRKVFD